MSFDGVFPPMTTAFDGDEVDCDGIRFNVEKWVRAGVRGVVALGSNGEAPLLDDDESDRVVETTREALPSTHVLIAGAGRESTRATIAACTRAAALGADAVLVRTPSYYKPRMTPDAFLRHYRAVADASAVPVLLYNYPAITGVNLAPESVAALAEHPNIVGIKETGSDSAQFAAYVDLTPRTFATIAGSAPTFYASLCLGAAGGILAAACVVPEVCIRLFDTFRAGRHAEARDLQQRLTPLAKLVTVGFGVPGLKTAMDLAGYVGGDPRPPLGPTPPHAIEQIRTELHQVLSNA